MTIKFVRYSILIIAALFVLNFLTKVKKAYNGEIDSVTTELPAKETPAPVATKPTSTPSGKSLAVDAFVPTFVSNALKTKKEYPVLTLGKSNTIVFRDIVTAQSMGSLERQLLAMSHELPISTPIYIVLETPGGDVDAGLQMVDMAKALPQEIKTITLFSASMGFHIVQSLGERLITPSGTLMSHRVSIEGLSGSIPGEAVVRLNKIIKQSAEMDSSAAKRIGLSFKDYQALVHDEYWISGPDAVTDHMADKVVYISCAKDLTGTYTQNIPTLLGTVSVQWSRCPAISSPLSNNADSLLSKITEPKQRKDFTDFLNMYFNDKEQFIKSYMINQEYKHFVY